MESDIFLIPQYFGKGSRRDVLARLDSEGFRETTAKRVGEFFQKNFYMKK